MSHFTVCVRVPDQLVSSAGSIEAAVAKLMAPYQENNMGDCPKEFLAFHDQEDEYLAEYENEGTKMVRCEDGSLVYPWDERFRVPGSFGSGSGTHKVPEHLKEERIANKDRFPTFEAYVEGWHSVRARDAEKNRYGYWENPNKKWDGWQIGGRWTGFFPIKDGSEIRLGSRSWASGDTPGRSGDIARVSEIDFDRIGEETNKRAAKFWEEWQRLLTGERFSAFDGPREKAMRIGLLDVKQTELTDDERTRCLPWKGLVPETDTRSTWHDVYKVVTKEQFLRDYLISFNPITTFAQLDEDGWHEAGRMGWFGCSSDTPDTYMQLVKDFPSWLRATPADAWLVVVDCHI